MSKYIDADLLRNEIERILGELSPDFYEYNYDAAKTELLNLLLSFIDSLQQEQNDMGEVSDGYHTFNELYYYRMLYNAAFFNLLPKEWVHKSKRHHTGEECFGGGWFIVMANLPTGQVSNHYELKDWDLFQIPEKETADEWDGHTPQEAAERLHKYLQQEQLEKPVPNDLEEEIKRYGEKNMFNIPAFQQVARHFAEWGAEHAGGSLGTMVSGWIARDRNGHLNFFLAEPRRFTNVRGEEYWIGHARMKMPNEFLPELSWSNEPIKVKLKVEKYESSKN